MIKIFVTELYCRQINYNNKLSFKIDQIINVMIINKNDNEYIYIYDNEYIIYIYIYIYICNRYIMIYVLVGYSLALYKM